MKIKLFLLMLIVSFFNFKSETIKDAVLITPISHATAVISFEKDIIYLDPTDLSFFGGTMADLMEARVINQEKPILRKDFIVDGFQIVEAKAIGADVILLIAACLTSLELKNYGNLAKELGLEVLYEVHTQEDLDKIGDLDNKIIGINNRNLNTFEVDLEHSIKLASQIPDSSIKVSESGISDPRIITGLKEYGFQGFLIGENFMKEENPGEACMEFISQIR